MSGLPDRPDLDQLRRQARELLRAAANGDPYAVARLGAVSGGVTLSAAQLALAREYGYPSWPKLRAEVERRRLSAPAADPSSRGGGEQGSPNVPGERWSFGGAAAIQLPGGVLSPEVLAAGAGHAVLYGSLTPSGSGQSAAAGPRRLPAPGTLFAPWSRLGRGSWSQRPRQADAATAVMRSLIEWAGAVTVVDDRETRYSLRAEGMRGHVGLPARSVRLKVDPVPGPGTGWIELRGQHGAATRLLPSARAAVQAGDLAPVAVSPAERELTDEALSLIALHLGPVQHERVRQRCAAALARTAQLQRSGELDPDSELADQITQLCSVLTGHRPAGGLPSSWSGMLDAAGLADGPSKALDIGVVLPPVGGVSVGVDTLVSSPGNWRLFLRARPAWRDVSEEEPRGRSPLSVRADDDRGGTYVSTFGGNTGPAPREEDLGGNGSARPAQEEFALRFVPRLHPLARAVKVTWTGAGEEVVLHLGLQPAAAP